MAVKQGGMWGELDTLLKSKGYGLEKMAIVTDSAFGESFEISFGIPNVGMVQIKGVQVYIEKFIAALPMVREIDWKVEGEEK